MLQMFFTFIFKYKYCIVNVGWLIWIVNCTLTSFEIILQNKPVVILFATKDKPSFNVLEFFTLRG